MKPNLPAIGRLFHPSGAFDQTRAIVFLCALIFGSVCGTVHAIDDIPEGGFRWIQGYDGNEPTVGFRVDGRLRIEAPDEPQSVGINLSSGRIDVGTTGEILVQYGPGGSRFINGDLVNEGLVALKSVLLFSRDGAEWVNRGVIEAATYMGLGITGKGARFRQVSGEIRVAGPSSRFEFYNQSRFIYEGGRVLARPLLVAASAEVASETTQELALRFAAQGSTLEGRFPSDLSVAVASDEAFGPGSLLLNTVTPIEGVIELVAASGSPGALLQLPDSGMTLAPRGVLRVKPGAGLSEIRGGLAVEGLLDIQGSAQWSTSGKALTHRGKVRLPFGGRLQVTAPLVQTGGTLQVEGGELALSQGLSIEGGTVIAAGILSGHLTNGALAVVDQEQPGRVRGEWTQTSAGTLRVKVRETSVASGAALQVTGPLNLRGTLEVVLADGVQLSRGAVLKLVQADSLNGWFERLVLPPLAAGLHWQVVPSEDEVRLSVRDTPPPVLIEWVQRTSGDRVRVSGPWSPETQAVLRVSHDLRNWTTVERRSPFAGLTWFPVPKPDEPGTAALTVFQAILSPVSPPEGP
jgi:hypothetical protein